MPPSPLVLRRVGRHARDQRVLAALSGQNVAPQRRPGPPGRAPPAAAAPRSTSRSRSPPPAARRPSPNSRRKPARAGRQRPARRDRRRPTPGRRRRRRSTLPPPGRRTRPAGRSPPAAPGRRRRRLAAGDLRQLRHHRLHRGLRGPIEHDPHRAVLVVLGDEDDGSREVRVHKRRRGDKSLPRSESSIPPFYALIVIRAAAPAKLEAWRSTSPRGLPGARDRALARGPRGRRLLGRVVRSLPDARAPRSRRQSPSGRARSSWPRWTPTRNQTLAASFQIRGIPAVKAFRTARSSPSSPAPSRRRRSSSSSTGSSPPRPTSSPTRATRTRCARRSSSTPRSAAATKLGRLLLARGETAEALELLEVPRRLRGRGPGRPGAADRRARRRARRRRRERCRGLLGLGRRRPRGGPRGLQKVVAETDDPDRRDLVRSVMVAIFTELGADHPLAREHRRRLAAALH